ncbi:hypothetical protein D1007_00466 [Hordeum vulgare]|nr:hypothetical protein D1007_00466 [Hordeum vulgare]
MAAASRAAAAEAAIGAMIDDHAAGSRKRRRIGSTEDYELSRVLGAGGFGVVIKAQHRATGEDVALKFLVCSTDGGGGGKRERHRAHALHHDLLREACYLAACRGHPPSSAYKASRGTPAPGSAASSWSTSARASPTSCALAAGRSRRRRRAASCGSS